MDDFFTLTSFATLTGSVVAVVVIVNALRSAINWGPRWFGLLVSIGVAFIALAITSSMGEGQETAGMGWIKYFTTFVNGCLIYTSAFGIQNTVVAAQPSEKGVSFQGVEEDEEEEEEMDGEVETIGISNGNLTFRKRW